MDLSNKINFHQLIVTWGVGPTERSGSSLFLQNPTQVLNGMLVYLRWRPPAVVKCLSFYSRQTMNYRALLKFHDV